MSGGAWGYRNHNKFQGVANAFNLLASIEHELDWGVSCDTCLECAKARVIEALMLYFGGDFDASLDTCQDDDRNRCSRHK